jgi:hypothetical protein
MHRTLLLVCGTTLLAGLLTGPVNAASRPGGCPPAFTGPVTLDELVQTPQIQAALTDGVYDEAHVRTVFAALDNNGDARVCWKSVGNGNQFSSIYAGDYVDNNAAPK